MSDFVWVKLDRDEAEAAESWAGALEAQFLDALNSVDKSARAKLQAALSEPSENQVERVAKAIADSVGDDWDDDLLGPGREVWRKAARAVLFGVQDA